MDYKAVLFDFDYTLGDATFAIVAGFTHALSTMGHPVPSEDVIRHTVGLMLSDAYTSITGDNDPDRRIQFRDLFMEVGHAIQVKEPIPLFEGARELLLALYEAGIPVGIVSSKRQMALDAIFTNLGLKDKVSLIIGGNSVTRPKPDPEGLLKAAEMLSLSPSEILYCGDTIIDAQAAQDGEFPFYAVLNGTTGAQAFDSFPKVGIATHLNQLHSHLLG